MSKQKTTYVCNRCGAVFPQWFGKCPACEEWDTLGEYREAAFTPAVPRHTARQSPVSVSDVPVEQQPGAPSACPNSTASSAAASCPACWSCSPATRDWASPLCSCRPPTPMPRPTSSASTFPARNRCIRSPCAADASRLAPKLFLLSETEVSAVEEQVVAARPACPLSTLFRPCLPPPRGCREV